MTRDGEQVWESDSPGFVEVEVPPEDGRFVLSTEIAQKLRPFSTTVKATWTFRSGHVDGDEPLPLTAIRFAPRVDASNRVPAGLALVPLSADAQEHSAAEPVRALTVSASHDDGRTWRRVPVFPAGRGQWVAVTNAPKGTTFVSLRAQATDRSGNSVDQTIIRAYGVR